MRDGCQRRQLPVAEMARENQRRFAVEPELGKKLVGSLAYFDPAFEEVSVGPAICSPQREGFEAEFLDFRVGDPVSRDIH